MSVLVAYGVPPNKIKLFSRTGVNLHQTWQFEPKTFAGAARENFERLLRTALLAFAGTEVPDLARADYRFVPDVQTLGSLLARGLRGRRFDDIEVKLQTMQLTDFRILSQPVFHLGPVAAATTK
jgi:hypothetical protein